MPFTIWCGKSAAVNVHFMAKMLEVV